MLHFSSALLNCAGCFFFPSCKCALYLAKLCKWHKRCCFPHFQVSITEHTSTIFISPPNDSHSFSCIRTLTLAGKISIAFARHSRVNKRIAPNKKKCLARFSPRLKWSAEAAAAAAVRALKITRIQVDRLDAATVTLGHETLAASGNIKKERGCG